MTDELPRKSAEFVSTFGRQLGEAAQRIREPHVLDLLALDVEQRGRAQQGKRGPAALPPPRARA